MILENIEKKFPQKKSYSDLSAVRVACLFVVKALNKLVEEMNNQVYFDFGQNGLILRATDKEQLQKANNKLEHWKEQTSIGILTDGISKEDYKKFIDTDLQQLLRQERAFINVISFDKFLAACEFLEKKGYKEPRAKYEEIQKDQKNFALLMCTKHRFKEIKDRIEIMLEPLRKVKKKKKVPSSLKLASTWDDENEIQGEIQEQNIYKKPELIDAWDTQVGEMQYKQDYEEFKDKNEQITKKESLIKDKDILTHESVVLEIEQWLFYFPQILKIIQESEKINIQDNENNFQIYLEQKKYLMEENNHNEDQSNEIKVGYLHIKILKENISQEQQAIINQIKLKSGQYLDHILSNKIKQFVNYLFSEMEPEEKEYFTVYSLRELLDQAYSLADQQLLKQIKSARKKSIVQNLKNYIKKFECEYLDIIENNDFIYHQYFLVGEQNMQNLFAETVDRTEMMFLKNYMTNTNNQEYSQNELDYEDMDSYEISKPNLKLNNQNQPIIDDYNENINYNQNNHQNINKKLNNQDNNHKENSNGGKKQNKEVIDYYQAALKFLTTNKNINNQQIQQNDVQLIQVDQSQLIVNKNNNKIVEYQNICYYLKKIYENQLQESIESLEKCNQYFNKSFSLISKVIQINTPSTNQDKQSNQVNNQKQSQNEFGILIEKKEYNLKQLIEEGQVFSVYQQVNIALKLVKCLNQIHSQRESRGAHCNLKTQNILFDKSYNIYLCDIKSDCKKNTLNHYQFENMYTNALNQIKNKLKAQFILQLTEEQPQKHVNNNQNNQKINQQPNNKQHNQFSNKQGDDNQNHHQQKKSIDSNHQLESQFKKAFQQQQNIFYNQLGDIQALGLILYQLFTGKCITAENYFLKHHRQNIKRMSQESPTNTLKSIFSLIFSLLELQNTSTENILLQLQDIYSNF